MAHHIPKVRFGLLESSECENKFSKSIPIDSAEWYIWLENHHKFCFENTSGTISVRKELRMGNWYWYAYRRFHGKLCTMYLGKSEELNLERLNQGIYTLVTMYTLTTSIQPSSSQDISSTNIVLCNPVIAAKLYPASAPYRLISRTRLTNLLNEGVQRKLTLIVAPPGFGKTTLLNEWKEAHVNDEFLCAWLSLDESDNDLIHFLIYFISALQTIQADIGKDLLAQLFSSQLTMRINSVLSVLIHEITTTILHDFSFVFDNYYTVETQAVHDALTFLLEHLPKHMHIIIASRTYPPLPVARLRIQGQLAEVHTADLRYLPDEVVTFTNITMGLNLSKENASVIIERTEGWMAGLQLAVLSLQRWKDFTIFTRAFTGSSPYVLDYFSEEVFSRQPQDIQAFLLKTSILTHLNGSLCEAVLGQGDGQAQLRKVEQANLFLFPLDEVQDWYRYHHLFRSFLHYQLQRSFPDIVQELHFRASVWFERNKLENYAIEHAIARRDFERVVQLVERMNLTTLLQGQEIALLKWLGTLSDEQVHSRPMLCILYAQMLIFIKMESAAPDSQTRKDEMSIEATSSTIAISARFFPSTIYTESTEVQRISDQIVTISNSIRNTQEDGYRAIKLAKYALERLPEKNLYLRSIASLTLGFAHWLIGDEIEASQSLHDAQSLSQTTGDISIDLTATCSLALIQVIQGQLYLGTRTYQKVIELAANSSLQYAKPLLIEGMAYVGMSGLFRERNELDIAVRYLMKGIDIYKQQEAEEIGVLGIANGYVMLAKIKYAQGDRQGARTTLVYAEQYMQRCNVPLKVLTSLNVCRLHLSLIEEHVKKPISWSRKSNLSYLEEFEYVTLARILVAQGDTEEALTLLDMLLQAARTAQRIGSVIEIQILQAIAYQKQNNAFESLKILAHALSLAEEEGYVLLFVDEGEPMASLLETIMDMQRKEQKKTTPSFSLNYVRNLLAAFSKRDRGTYATLATRKNAVQTLADHLTIHESEIIQCITRGMSVQEIAIQMSVVDSTIKWHIKSIYSKLHVHNRSQLFVRVRELNI